ncbi:MAG: hypothetical protein WCL34_00765 [Methylococcaceae bacterium]|jgi:hypothetical protein
MSNLAIHSKKKPVLNNSSSVKTPVGKTTVKSVGSFGEAIKQLQEQATVYNPKNIQPNTSLRTDSIQVQGKVVFGFGDIETVTLDNPVITRTGGTKIPEPVPLSPGELAALQKSMADEAKFEKESAYQASPEGQKEYLMSKQVDAVARDAEGNIVAKIYKDGSLMCSNELGNSLSKCNSNAERIRLLEKNSNVVVSDYTKEKVTDFDLLKEEFAQIEKRLAIHPELRALYDPDIVELQRRTLAA